MVRLVIAAGIGPPAALLTGALLSRGYAPAVGWDAAALTYCAVVWIVIWPMDAAATAALAKAEDPNRAIADLLTLIACVASLVAVGVVLVVAHSARRGG